MHDIELHFDIMGGHDRPDAFGTIDALARICAPHTGIQALVFPIAGLSEKVSLRAKPGGNRHPGGDIRYLPRNTDTPEELHWRSLPEPLRRDLAYDLMEIVSGDYRGDWILNIATTYLDMRPFEPVRFVVTPHTFSFIRGTWDFDVSTFEDKELAQEYWQEQLHQCLHTTGLRKPQSNHDRLTMWTETTRLQEDFTKLYFPGDYKAVFPSPEDIYEVVA